MVRPMSAPKPDTTSINAYWRFIAECAARSPDARLDDVIGFDVDHIVELAANECTTCGTVIEELSKRLAVGFHERRMSFDHCDVLMNCLWSAHFFNHNCLGPESQHMRAELDWSVTEITWAIFEAFDAGEWHHDPEMRDDPVQEQTVPLVAAIVSKL